MDQFLRIGGRLPKGQRDNGQRDKGSNLEHKDHVETRSHTRSKESTGEIWRGHHRPSRDPMERKRGD